MGNRAIITTVGRTTYKLEKNEGGKKERVYLCKDGNWYRRNDFPVLNPCDLANSSWIKIIPEETCFCDDYNNMYKIKGEQLLRFGYLDDTGRLRYLREPEIID